MATVVHGRAEKRLLNATPDMPPRLHNSTGKTLNIRPADTLVGGLDTPTPGRLSVCNLPSYVFPPDV